MVVLNNFGTSEREIKKIISFYKKKVFEQITLICIIAIANDVSDAHFHETVFGVKLGRGLVCCSTVVGFWGVFFDPTGRLIFGLVQSQRIKIIQ